MGRPWLTRDYCTIGEKIKSIKARWVGHAERYETRTLWFVKYLLT